MKGTPVERVRGTPAELHALDVGQRGRGGGRRMYVLEATSPGLVLGSTQPESHVDGARAEAAGIAVVRRRSGGGAVWVTSKDPIWIDIWIPHDDPLWVADVGRAFAPIGAAMGRAIQAIVRRRREIDLSDLTLHSGPLIRTEAGSMVCWAGVGPGEVMRRGQKLVGISQRRTRAGARFQCAIYRHWDPGPLHGLLVDGPDLGDLRRCGAGLDSVGIADVDPEQLAEAAAVALADEVGL